MPCPNAPYAPEDQSASRVRRPVGCFTTLRISTSLLMSLGGRWRAQLTSHTIGNSARRLSAFTRVSAAQEKFCITQLRRLGSRLCDMFFIFSRKRGYFSTISVDRRRDNFTRAPCHALPSTIKPSTFDGLTRENLERSSASPLLSHASSCHHLLRSTLHLITPRILA